jgi:anaerobic selenocysteine-containing dehydrogenase
MGESRTVKGCCPLDCQDTCSWVAEVNDGRVTAIRGAKDHPFTRGVLCAKVNDYPTRTYSPERLLHPLRRVGPKGSGQFGRISWDTALNLVAERFTSIAATHGAEALLPHRYLGSMGMVQFRSPLRLFHALGASRISGGICNVAANEAAKEGLPLGFDPETTVDSRLILLWGVNILTTCHHHWHFIQEARRRHGARVICIDPIRTRTARQCDEHLAVRPGTDTVLAAGMARVMLEEGLADLDFARGACADLDALTEAVAPWTPDRVAEVCGIDADTVVRLAREFAQARPAQIRGGVGPQQSANGEEFVRALHSLAVLGGHWRHSGGGVLIKASPDVDPLRVERPDLIPAGRSPRFLDMARLGETLTDTTLAPPVHGLMIWGTNPAVVQADAGRVRRGLMRDDLFTVVLEHFMTETASFADIVLPSTTQLEHFDILGAWGHQYITVNLPAVEPLGETKSHGEITRLLAKRMGLDHPALRESDEAIAAAALPANVDLATLKQAGWVKTPRPAPELATAKLRLAPQGGVALPVAPPTEGMLRLMTPKAHFFLNSSFANQPRQRKAEGKPTLDMTLADASARGLRDGEVVQISNAQGAIPATLRITDAVVAGVVSLPGKFWGTLDGAVSNLLSPSAWSPGGQPAFNDIFVEVAGAAAQDAGASARDSAELSAV